MINAEPPAIIREVKVKEDKEKQEKVDKPDKEESANRCIQTPMPANAPEGSYFDFETCVWRDRDGNQIGPG